MTPAEEMAAALAALGPTPPIFVIRRARCGCKLGAVQRTKLAGFVVAGARRGVMVEPDEFGVRRWRAWYVQSLEEPAQPEGWGCQHGDGVLPLADLLARARDTRASGPYVIE